jgi:peroxiredoxin
VTRHQQTEAGTLAAKVGDRVTLPGDDFRDAGSTPHVLTDALRRGPLLLAIYKSSCQASKTIFPFLERIAQRHAGSPLAVLGVSQDSANIARSFARRTGVTFPLLIDEPTYPLSRALAVGFTPTAYLIRPDGTIAFVAEGFLRFQIEELSQAVAAELGVPASPLIDESETEVPFFVPG